jgi:hypothetical protein
MRAKRSIIGAVAVFAGLLTPVSAQGPAAAAPEFQAQGVRILIAPPAPSGADQKATEMSVAAVEPDTTPGVTSHPVAPGETYECTAGYFCPLVWNYVTRKWKVFFMYFCRIQHLQNWIGGGYYYNNQIPPVNPVDVFNQNGKLISALVVENPRRTRPIDWTPAWSLDVC